MLYANSSEPLYKQLYHKLREAIEDGKFEVGHKLPSERALAAEHGISRLTARKAVSLLRQDGYVKAYQGKGSFVTKAEPKQPGPQLGGFTEAMREQGITPSSKLLSCTIVTTDEEIAAQLQIEPGDKAIKIHRLRYGDGEPLAVDTSYLRYPMCTNIIQADLEQVSLYQVLEEKMSIELDHVIQTLEATLGSKKDLDLLGLDAPSAVMYLKRQTFDSQERVIEYCEVVYRSDRCNVKLPTRSIGEVSLS